MGKGKISPEAFALILAHPGKPFFPEIAPANARGRFFAISPELDMRSLKTPHDRSIRVESSIAACLRMRETPNARRREKLLHRRSTLNEGTFLAKPAALPTIKKYLTDCLRA